MRFVGLIPVRGGSKGFPGKNTREFAGQPLYRRSVDQAIRTVGSCIVTTDIHEILEAPEIPPECTLLRRPTDLATDEAVMADVVHHAIENEHSLKDAVIVLLQATSPLRADADIHRALSLYSEAQHEIVMTVVEADPKLLKAGSISAGDFIPMSEPQYCFANRQTLPKVYEPNGAVYVFAATAFLESGGFPSKRIGAVIMPMDRSLDIDTELDYQLAVEALRGEDQHAK